jgi:ABC-2 type transport system permease protein
VNALTDDTFAGVHQLTWFDWSLLIPYFAIGLFDVLLAFIMGEFIFKVPFRGSLALLFGMAGVFLVGTQSLGVLISVVSRNQLMANQLAMLVTFMPSFLLSGFMYAIANMPKPVQLITYFIPARYFIALMRGVYLKGVGLEILGTEAALLAVFSALMLALALLRFRKKLE